MRNNEHLFWLIQGLTKSEKGYFKKYASVNQAKNNNYIKLFDAVAMQKKYDEAAIKKQFAGESFVSQLSVTKNYLYNLILKWMEIFHGTNNIDIHIRSLINRASFLYEKGRDKEFEKLLYKAKAISKKYELFHFILEILDIERTSALKRLDFDKISAIKAEEATMLNLIQTTKQFQDLAESIMMLFFKKGRIEKQKHLMRNDIKHPLLKNEKNAKTFLAKKNFFNSYVFYYFSINKVDKALEYSQKRVNLFLESPAFIRYYTRDYLGSLNNVLYTCFLLRKMTDMKFFIDKLAEAKIYALNINDESVLFYLNYHILNYYNALGLFETATKHCEGIVKNIATFENNLNDNERLVLRLHIAYSYFGAGDHRKSLLWLNKIINEIKMAHNPDAQTFHRLFYLINHFELGNFELLPFLIKSIYRFMATMKRLSKFQKNILSFFKQILQRNNSNIQQKKQFSHFKKIIQHSDIAIIGSGAFEYFDYISWLESKIENRPFAEVVREKAAKQQ